MQPMQPMPSQRPTPAARVGPSLVLSIVILLAGIGVGIVGLVGLGAPVVRNIASGKVLNSPGSATVELKKGHYGIYAEQQAGSFSAVIRPTDVSVMAPDGTSVDVYWPDSSETRTRNSTSWRLTVEFTADSPGFYEVQIDSPTQGRAMVARRIGDSVNASWVLAVLLGGALALVGLILLIVGIVRRSRSNPPMVGPWQQPYGGGPYGGGPYGGYPTPGGPGGYPPPGAYPPPGGYPPQGGYPPGGGYPPAGPSGWSTPSPPPDGAQPGSAAQPAPWSAPPATPGHRPSFEVPSYEPYRPPGAPAPVDDPSRQGWASPSEPPHAP